VECALKACIAKATQRCEFPDKQKVDSSYSHDLSRLIKVAGLADAHREKADHDTDFSRNLEIVREWSEQSRYQRHLPETAKDLLEAVGDRPHGVISWIKLHW
jgi:hypothetical protein